jgi:hypothetical protein
VGHGCLRGLRPETNNSQEATEGTEAAGKGTAAEFARENRAKRWNGPRMDTDGTQIGGKEEGPRMDADERECGRKTAIMRL